MENILNKYDVVIDMLYNQVIETEGSKDRLKLLVSVVNSYSKVLECNINSKKIQELSDQLDKYLNEGLWTMSRIYDLTRKANRLLNTNDEYKDIDILVDSDSVIYLIDNKEIHISRASRYLNTLRDKAVKCTFEIILLD